MFKVKIGMCRTFPNPSPTFSPTSETWKLRASAKIRFRESIFTNLSYKIKRKVVKFVEEKSKSSLGVFEPNVRRLRR